MIRVKFFPRNSIKNLWGILPSPMNREIENFLEETGCKQSQSGVNLGTHGVWVSYEDGIFSDTQKLDILRGDLVKNEITIIKQQVILGTLTDKKEESEIRLEEAKAELDEALEKLKENSESGEEPLYKELKPKIDELKAEIKHLEDVISNCNTQIAPTAGDIERLDTENRTLRNMIWEIERNR